MNEECLFYAERIADGKVMIMQYEKKRRERDKKIRRK
jgi:hypothetical protein